MCCHFQSQSKISFYSIQRILLAPHPPDYYHHCYVLGKTRLLFLQGEPGGDMRAELTLLKREEGGSCA